MDRDNKSKTILEARLATYFATASAIGTACATELKGAVVAHTNPISFGINEEVNIDFNGDGAAEFQIDHDRVNVNGMNLDFLQLDKNDASSAAKPLPIDVEATFPGVFRPIRADYTGDGVGSWDLADLAAWKAQYGMSGSSVTADSDLNQFVDGQDFLNWQRMTNKPFSYDQEYMSEFRDFGDNSGYVSALEAGISIGPSDLFTFQEGRNFESSGLSIHTNRLIDEDAGKIDTANGIPAYPISDTPHFLGLGGETRYIGVRFDLGDEGFAGNINQLNGPDSNGDGFGEDDPANYWYGWIGIQITNEADATGVVTGWAYEDQIGTAILAGDTGAPLVSSVPEPSSLMIAVGGFGLASNYIWRRLRKGNSR
jgi:PEP-CTERM motif